ncbi:hypothetical protein L3X38_012790 [Prunus dulcis]|uniref:Uncharacterized protein n=1 Tax=Prunus dulcis TaxID=3755 RepID=A0AAD4WJZ2_PRUDU|nr:hypothetical protein L3X38_012790 [Prunus dulcis]
MDSTSIFSQPSPNCHSLCNETYMQYCTQPDNSKAQISSPHTPTHPIAVASDCSHHAALHVNIAILKLRQLQLNSLSRNQKPLELDSKCYTAL